MVFWCYLLDCTNTDLGSTLIDCYWPQDNPIYNNVHLSAGCEESCEICPEGDGGDGTADIETFAATGSYSCADIFDLGSNGYFSVDECSALQSSLPQVCGCTGSDGAAPSGPMPMFHQGTWSLVAKYVMMAGAVVVFVTDCVTLSI
jgi:hypothetical protein